MSWILDLVNPRERKWEEFYRNRWSHDNVFRSTHGVNCTGGCSWAIYVKDGIVTWEMQQTDYPLLERSLPPYEPRGCQRGISASWYVYSPIRVKYPYVRGPLLDLWREAKASACRSGGGLGRAGRGRTKAFAHPEGARQGRFPPRQVGRAGRADRRCQLCTRRASGGRTG